MHALHRSTARTKLDRRTPSTAATANRIQNIKRQANSGHNAGNRERVEDHDDLSCEQIIIKSAFTNIIQDLCQYLELFLGPDVTTHRRGVRR
jgi:hypothetical protein